MRIVKREDRAKRVSGFAVEASDCDSGRGTHHASGRRGIGEKRLQCEP
jgi:hypothetical protein